MAGMIYSSPPCGDKHFIGSQPAVVVDTLDGVSGVGVQVVKDGMGGGGGGVVRCHGLQAIDERAASATGAQAPEQRRQG